MCGVAGSIGHLDPGRIEAVRVMNRAQRHRGPDDEGLWWHVPAPRDRGIVLGHRRLTILDLIPAGHQPMIDAESGCVISFNGEIYNFLELRKELEAEGVRFESSCDTELI